MSCPAELIMKKTLIALGQEKYFVKSGNFVAKLSKILPSSI